MEQAAQGFNEAKSAINAGRATAHALWMLLSDEHDRDGFALKPAPWEGSGEYQRVEFNDGRDVLVRVPGDGTFTLPDKKKAAINAAYHAKQMNDQLIAAAPALLAALQTAHYYITDLKVKSPNAGAGYAVTLREIESAIAQANGEL